MTPALEKKQHDKNYRKSCAGKLVQDECAPRSNARYIPLTRNPLTLQS